MEAVWFCEQIIVAAREWALRNKDTPNLNANLPNLVRHRARGLPPCIVNVPVIA
jgi:hypothetical protein